MYISIIIICIYYHGVYIMHAHAYIAYYCIKTCLHPPHASTLYTVTTVILVSLLPCAFHSLLVEVSKSLCLRLIRGTTLNSATTRRTSSTQSSKFPEAARLNTSLIRVGVLRIASCFCLCLLDFCFFLRGDRVTLPLQTLVF